MSRIIAHVDMDAFFASVEQQANPFLRGKPIAVTGKHKERSIVAAASKEAKACGIKTAMSTYKAEQLCPDILFVPGDSKKYTYLNTQFNRLFGQYSDRVERFGIDESFLDLTGHVADFMEAGLQMQQLKQDIREHCGTHIVASVGVGPNKLIAKSASDYDKPDGLTVVCPQDVISFLDRLAPDDICGIGPQITKKLEALGITTVKQLREYPRADLVDMFHSYGYFLHEAAHGRDGTDVHARTDEPKSMGHAYTLSTDSQDAGILWSHLLGLADKVAWRLRQSERHAQRVCAHVRYGDFTSKRQQVKFDEPTADGLTLARIAWRLMRPWIKKAPVRQIGLTASALCANSQQQPIFPHDQKRQALTRALDRIQTRYGNGVWTRAARISAKFKERSSGF